MPTLPAPLRGIVGRLKGVEPLGLMIFGLISGGVLLFQWLADEVLEGETKGIDETVLLALRQPGDLKRTIGSAWVSHAATDITSLGGVTVLTLATFLTVLYLLSVRRKAMALFVFLAIAGGWLLSTSLKILIARQRPDIVPHLVDINDFSFPSGHAMLSAVTYLTLAGLLARHQATRSARVFMLATGVFLTFIIGCSRVLLGVHYPTDVLAGWCAGATWALMCWYLARRLIAPPEQAH
ncbi:phosphatase PAP2 family protein [Rhizobiaceae bacterium CRRU44]|uniref:Phosphatase PAP2 family protein n=1 Tax=Ferranicluibacter rubi TaxID=2715133 RepID=A0AA43ZHL5_9HYPH|nr:phosphatase PAP2 family protein [Ferranicluibacter rubi]NHT77804.1 phosphatase PAP2 family protein [Ferranicluibacter rubi]